LELLLLLTTLGRVVVPDRSLLWTLEEPGRVYVFIREDEPDSLRLSALAFGLSVLLLLSVRTFSFSEADVRVRSSFTRVFASPDRLRLRVSEDLSTAVLSSDRLRPLFKAADRSEVADDRRPLPPP